MTTSKVADKIMAKMPQHLKDKADEYADSLVEDKEETVTTYNNEICSGWKIIKLNPNVSLKELIKTKTLFYFIWGFDIFYDNVPIIKLMILLNIIMWVLMWFFN